MKVFISWSGHTSQQVAIVFRDWLPSVIQSIQPYVSSEDIDKGTRWSTDIAQELANSTFGILCVTKDNLEAPWISFEAGALSKTMDKSFVSPFLFNIKRSEVKGPLLQFQSTIFQKEDLNRLISTLNKASENPLSDTRLTETFDVWYPILEEKLKSIKGESEQTGENTKREDYHTHSSEILEEILELSRRNQLLLKNTEKGLSDNEKAFSERSEDLKKILQNQSELIERSSIGREKRRMIRHYPMVMEDMAHMMPPTPFAIPLLLGPYKTIFPWIYDSGMAVLNTLLSNSNIKAKEKVCNDFIRIIELTMDHPFMRELYGDNPESMMLLKSVISVIPSFLRNVTDYTK